METNTRILFWFGFHWVSQDHVRTNPNVGFKVLCLKFPTTLTGSFLQISLAILYSFIKNWNDWKMEICHIRDLKWNWKSKHHTACKSSTVYVKIPMSGHSENSTGVIARQLMWLTNLITFFYHFQLFKDLIRQFRISYQLFLIFVSHVRTNHSKIAVKKSSIQRQVLKNQMNVNMATALSCDPQRNMSL